MLRIYQEHLHNSMKIGDTNLIQTNLRKLTMVHHACIKISGAVCEKKSKTKIENLNPEYRSQRPNLNKPETGFPVDSQK